MKFNSNILHPAWVTGFIDGERTFHVRVLKNSTMRLGYQVQLQFAITQHIRDKELMEKFIPFFGNIGLIVNDGPTKVQYRIRSFKHFPVLFDLLDQYPLQTQKALDAECFKNVYNMMLNKEHLTEIGLDKILAIKATMNRSRKYDTIIPVL